MSLLSFFSGMQLTSDQGKTLAGLNEFFSGSNKVFILKGYAGTGKTTILEGIAKYLHSQGRLGHIMAPTGRAAKVIQDKTGYPATTIHKAIYNLDELETYEAKDAGGNETFKFFFTLKNPDNPVNKVYIFDEASMIGNKYTEGEFFRFGSGHLLSDILEHFDLLSNKNTKLIFVGDPAQLPTVGDNCSSALEETFFTDKGISNTGIEMTEVVRQREKSGILENAKYYRKLIFSTKIPENRFNTAFPDIEQINVEQLGDKFTEIEELPDISKSIVIVFKNETAYRYNKIIRSRYFPGHEAVTAGDILQVVRNNYSNAEQEFLNGEFIKILDVSNKVEEQSAPIKQAGKKDKIVTLKFRDAEVLHPSGNIINIKLLDTLLNSKFRDLSPEETKALYINFIIRFEKRTGKKANRKSEGFKEAFKRDEYFNALQVKYGYAITGHKSQGGEWENAFVDFTGRVGLTTDVLRWTYTAITRASKKLYVLYPPGVNRIEFKNTAPSIGKINKLPAGAISYPDADETPYHTKDTHPAKRLKYFEIEEKLHEAGYAIERVISEQYKETYFINNGTETHQIIMHHKADGIFSSYAANNVNDETKKLTELIKQKVPWPDDYRYEKNNPLVKKLYNRVLAAMQDLDINLLGIDDSKMQNYYVAFYFRTSAEGAYIQFYFDKNERVKSMIVKSLLGEEDKELRKMIDNLTRNN